MKKIALLLLTLCCTAGCETVKPWERDILAQPGMQIEADPLDAQLASQVYDSKEASSGGNNPAGGGCGCN